MGVNVKTKGSAAMGVYDYEGDIPSIHTFGRKMKLIDVMRILERETDE